MARTAKARAKAAPKRAPAADFDRAVKNFLKAIPVDHLDQRLTELERYVKVLQKDMSKLVRDMGPRPARKAAVTRTAQRRTATRRTTRARRHAAAA